MENKSIIAGVVVLLLAVLLVPMTLSRLNRTPSTSTAPVAAPAPATPPPVAPPSQEPPARPVLDAAILDKLLYGMTYSQVVAVLGGEADESESQYERGKTGYTGPTLTIWKTWVNPDGSKLRVGFVESKLEQKQFKFRERAKESDGER